VIRDLSIRLVVVEDASCTGAKVLHLAAAETPRKSTDGGQSEHGGKSGYEYKCHRKFGVSYA
jgi:hypothetical protein